jgi:hypothetical protein
MFYSKPLLGFFYLVAALLAACNNGASGDQANPQDDRRAFSADRSVSILAPAGWTVRTAELPRGVKMFLQSPSEGSLDAFGEYIMINEDTLANGDTLADYIRSLRGESARQFEEFSVIKDSTLEISGQPARMLVFRAKYRENGVAVVLMSYFVQNGRVVYTINASTLPSTYETWGAKLQQLCVTFRLE